VLQTGGVPCLGRDVGPPVGRSLVLLESKL
jgi:hypothetical protein